MRRLALPLLILACATTLACLCFGAALFGGEQFAFRDTGFFYYPLNQRVQQEWDAGRWPLWDPQENGGMPLLGNPTAAVLYPGKVVYAVLPYPWAARVYVIAHVLLACAAMLALMRSWKTSWTGSALAALSFAFSAYILFQHSNVIFLVGAAWLPFGFRAVDRWLRLGRPSALLELAAVLALQALGGDPESAYVLGICGGGYGLGLAWQQRRFQIPDSRFQIANDQWLITKNPDRRVHLRRFGIWNLESGICSRLRGILLALASLAAWVLAALLMARWAPRWRAPQPPPHPLPWMTGFHWGVVLAWCCGGVALVLLRLRRGPGFVPATMLLGLAGSAVLASALGAAQLIPVWEFTSQSLRATASTHDIFALSLHPLLLAGLVWPNFFGDYLVTNRYWFEVLNRSDKQLTDWIPSIYLGGLTLVLAASAAGFRAGPPWRCWLTAVAGLSLLAALGEYASPLWWARFVPAIAREVGPHDPKYTTAIRVDAFLRDGDGSLYWALTTLLPGFRQFRFPCKLLTFTTLAVTALGGLGWDRATKAGSRHAARWACFLLALTVAGLALVTASRGWIVSRLATAASGLASPYGPLDAHGAYRDLRLALVQGAVVLVVALILLRLGGRRPRLASALALIAATADLALANSRYLLTVPQQLMEAEPKVVRVINDAERKDPASQPFRVHRFPAWFPVDWLHEMSGERLQRSIAWNRDSIQPKFGVPYGVEYTLTKGITGLYDYEWFFAEFLWPVFGEVANVLGVHPGDPVYYYPRRGFDLWNTRYFILPAEPHGWQDRFRSYAAFLDRTEWIYPGKHAFDGLGGDDRRQRWIQGEDLQVYRNESVCPRAWIVHRARFHQRFADLDPTGRITPVSELLFANDPIWHDPRRRVFDALTHAWVGLDKKHELSPFLPGIVRGEEERVMIRAYTPQRVELEAQLEQPGLVILADVDYPGWHLTIDGVEAPIYRVNFLMRGAAVRAGKHRLVYSFRPASFYWGRWISVAGLVVMGVLAARLIQKVLRKSAEP